MLNEEGDFSLEISWRKALIFFLLQTAHHESLRDKHSRFIFSLKCQGLGFLLVGLLSLSGSCFHPCHPQAVNWPEMVLPANSFANSFAIDMHHFECPY